MTMELRQTLWATAGAFGVAAWAVSLADATPPELAIPLTVLAAAVAVVGLWPGQVTRGWLAVVLAVTALAEAVTTTAATGAPTWGLIAIDVLVALQAAVAVAALVLESRGSAMAQSAPDDEYAAYARYVQAYHDYADRYGSAWPDEHTAAGTADAAAEATGLGEEEAWAAMRAKYIQHVSPTAPASTEHGHRRADGEGRGDAGLPGTNRADRSNDGLGRAARGSAPTSPAAY